MKDVRWQDDWRATEPLPDFASRVVSELAREERNRAWSARERRAFSGRRGSPLVFLGLAALLITGAALGSLGRGPFGPSPFGRRLHEVNAEQESSPTRKAFGSPVRIELSTPRAPMEPEPEQEVPIRPVSRSPLRELSSSPPARPNEPIHYPPCHCSSGAIVCSCVD